MTVETSQINAINNQHVIARTTADARKVCIGNRDLIVAVFCIQHRACSIGCQVNHVSIRTRHHHITRQRRGDRPCRRTFILVYAKRIQVE